MYQIRENSKIATRTYKMVLAGDTSMIKRSGQFINIKIKNHFLRRPISICDYDHQTITIIYKVFGEGTKTLSTYQVGEAVDCLVGLGNGFETSNISNVVLIGGGVGIPPLYNLAKQLNKPDIVLGFKTTDELFLVEEFKKLDCKVTVCLEDGQGDFKGNVVEYMQDKQYEFYYSCGPEKMLVGLVKALNFPGKLSFEERMACGFGACMGCSKLTKNGMIRVCKEGPVLDSEVVVYEN